MPTIITTPHSTSDLTSKRLVIDIADRISLLDINENPATFVIREIGSKKAKQPTVSWDTDEYRPDKTQINKAAGYLSTDTSLIVDNGDYAKAGDLWRVFDSYEIMYVQEVTGDTWTVIRNFPGAASGTPGAPTALVDNDWLEFVGNVFSEGGRSPDSMMTQEVQHDNYCQIIKTPFELTETELASLFNTEAQLPYETRKKAMEHQHVKERLTFWGLPSATQTGTNGKLMRTLGGAYYWIKTYAPSGNVASQAEITQAEFLEWLRNCFRYGSGIKFLFACPIVLSALEHWGLAKFEHGPGNTRMGVNVTEWISPHGLIHIVNHKMLEGPNPGTVGGWAFLLDMDEIEYRPLRDTRLETNIQDNDEDTYKAQYLTEFSLTFGNSSKHGVLKDVTSFGS